MVHSIEIWLSFHWISLINTSKVIVVKIGFICLFITNVKECIPSESLYLKLYMFKGRRKDS